MIPVFSILFAFFIVYLPYTREAEALPEARHVWVAGVVSIAIPYLFGLIAALAVRLSVGNPAGAALFFFRRIRRFLAAYNLLILVSFFLFRNLYLWPEYVHDRLVRTPGIETLLQILPFLLGLALSWTVQHSVEASLRVRSWRLREKMLFQARHALLPLIPVLFLAGLQELLEESAWLRELGARPEYEGIYEIAFFVPVFAVFALLPLLVRVLWPVGPLPGGEIRASCERMAAHHGVRLRNVLQWRTGGGRVLNACMIGVVPSLRYILLSDALLHRLSPDEVRAVFGHELCHAKRNHVLFYGMFLSSLTLLFGLPGIGESGPFGPLPFLGGVVVWLAAFGYISRRFERECDLFGAQAGGSYDAFVAALDKIAPGRGGLTRLHAFLHDSIPRRMEFLRLAREDPRRRARFGTTIRRIRAAILVLFLVSLALFVAFHDGTGPSSEPRPVQDHGEHGDRGGFHP